VDITHHIVVAEGRSVGFDCFWLRWRGGEKEREVEIGLKVTGHSAE
jgi:hypothetical protein